MYITLPTHTFLCVNFVHFPCMLSLYALSVVPVSFTLPFLHFSVSVSFCKFSLCVSHFGGGLGLTEMLAGFLGSAGLIPDGFTGKAGFGLLGGLIGVNPPPPPPPPPLCAADGDGM